MSDARNDNAALLKALLQLRAVERCASFKSAGGDPHRLSALADEAERLSFVDIPQALAATEAIVRLADELGFKRARARRARAQALAYAGRHEEALEDCHEAMRLAVVEGDPIEEARARLISLHPLNELGRFEEAVRMGESARLDLLRLGEEKLAARADFNLGGIHQNRDDPRQALLHFDRAAPAFQDDPLINGYLHNNRGEALLLLNDFGAAQEAFERALAATNHADAGVAAAIVEGNLADLAARRGRLPEALEHFERARRRFEKNKAEGHLARLLSEQAEAIATLGLAEDALAEYERILPRLAGLGLTTEVARSQLAIGRLFVRLERRAEAAQALSAAADAYDDLSQPRQKAHVDLLRADLLLHAEGPGAAAELLDDAARTLGDRPLDTALLDYHRARVEEQRGDFERAESLISGSLVVAEAFDLAPLMAEFLAARGDIRHAGGRLDEAITDFRAATQQIERVRESLHAEQHRAGFFGGRLQAYARLIEALLDKDPAGTLPEVFETIERSKSRGLLDVIRGAVDLHAPGSAGDAAEAVLQSTAAKLIEELNALYSGLSDTATMDRFANDRWRRAVGEREQELRRIGHRLSATARMGGWLAPPVTLGAIQSTLQPAAAFLQLFQLDEQLVALLIRRDSVRVERICVPAGKLVEMVEQLRFQIGRAARPGALAGARGERMLREVQAELQDLSTRILAPYAEELSAIEHLIIAPHGPLHLLPFQALWDGRQYLIEKLAISYAPSASVWQSLESRAANVTSRPSTAVVGVSDTEAPQIDAESRQLAAQLSGDHFIGSQATRAVVRGVLERYQQVHLACHARFSAAHPESSGLLLADGWLTLREIAPLRMDIDLITLSGCSTGQNIIKAGDELFGLLRAFLSAGARSIVASLWPAHDQGTFEVMSALYTGMSQLPDDPGRRAAALRFAQVRVLRRYPHPFIWAPFFLVGAS